MVICLYSKKAVWQLNCDSHIQQKAVSVLRAEPITTVTTATDSTPTVQRFRVQYRKVSVLHEVSNNTVTLEPTAKRLPYTSPTPHIQTHQFAIQTLPPTPTPTDPTADDPPPTHTIPHTNAHPPPYLLTCSLYLIYNLFGQMMRSQHPPHTNSI